MHWLGFVLGLLFTLVGAAVMAYGTQRVLLARASASWPTAAGEIVVSRVVESYDDDGSTYGPDVRYRYRAAGGSHEGDVIHFGLGGIETSNRRSAERVVDRYPQGSTVTIAYDPAKPDRAVLEPGVSKRSFVLVVFGYMFFSMGFGFTLLMWMTA